jgi:hypothetical protein
VNGAGSPWKKTGPPDDWHERLFPQLSGNFGQSIPTPSEDSTGTIAPLRTGPSARSVLPWAAAALAFGIAGIVVGRFAVGPGEDRKSREVVVAQLAVKNEGGRGGGVSAIKVDIGCQRPGFATVVVLSDPPETFPLRDEDNIATGPDVRGAYGPIEGKSNTAVLVVVTETPARETVRRAVGSGKVNLADTKAVREFILEALWRDNHRWASVEESRFPDAKP